ncbi:hypothetical protein PENSPDRAFT_736613 [Peniophora sp. CONT]|nr:hypothetical protein PENSPDRAFT_736613 [Peniophora sp. CONT]
MANFPEDPATQEVNAARDKHRKRPSHKDPRSVVPNPSRGEEYDVAKAKPRISAEAFTPNRSGRASPSHRVNPLPMPAAQDSNPKRFSQGQEYRTERGNIFGRARRLRPFSSAPATLAQIPREVPCCGIAGVHGAFGVRSAPSTNGDEAYCKIRRKMGLFIGGLVNSGEPLGGVAHALKSWVVGYSGAEIAMDQSEYTSSGLCLSVCSQNIVGEPQGGEKCCAPSFSLAALGMIAVPVKARLYSPSYGWKGVDFMLVAFQINVVRLLHGVITFSFLVRPEVVKKYSDIGGFQSAPQQLQLESKDRLLRHSMIRVVHDARHRDIAPSTCIALA